jgi:hydroxymethylpyrimidine pyrophosphatase-like HAD family hydrolase
MSLEASKENAVRHLTESRGIDIKDVLCFGDDFNDLGLFQTCGYSVAMGNAINELKEIASEITDTNDNDGVAMILERIVGELEEEGNFS